ncbi:hypothetical protein EVAR_47891_1 [Eumeta japonica]|uniref:Uncharacterized protein n=1 Tax=Eumeta variegata TaxID=151549 RepID=A0A4C1YC80_EUMVA|nr:hypothetical protein EVAR_47891_1 [Eumeta japonica]
MMLRLFQRVEVATYDWIVDNSRRGPDAGIPVELLQSRSDQTAKNSSLVVHRSAGAPVSVDTRPPGSERRALYLLFCLEFTLLMSSRKIYEYCGSATLLSTWLQHKNRLDQQVKYHSTEYGHEVAASDVVFRLVSERSGGPLLPSPPSINPIPLDEVVKLKNGAKSGIAELSLAERNATAEAVKSGPYFMRVWYLTDRSNTFSCYSGLPESPHMKDFTHEFQELKVSRTLGAFSDRFRIRLRLWPATGELVLVTHHPAQGLGLTPSPPQPFHLTPPLAVVM